MRSSLRAHRHGKRSRRWWGAVALVAVVALALVPSALAHRGHRDAGGRGLGHFAQRNLVSDIPGAAELRDGDLVNAWGLAFGPTTPAWVADNGKDVSTLYSGAVGGTPVVKSGLTVSIPGGAPTGAVFNGNPNAFVVHSGASSGSARFLFASEAGIISGWSPAVPAPPPSPSTQAQVAVPVPGAIFKGLAIADTATGPQIYATDFHNGQVDVWDANFAPVQRPGAFQDPAIPKGFAPFGIQAITGGIVVTYARQDADAEDDVAGAGNGFVDVFDTAGTLLRRFAARGPLNSPWGIAPAPQGFGRASGALLIGDFGDGRINAYDPVSAKFLGALRDEHGRRLAIDGLWALQFGNGVIGTPQTLLFTAGPQEESHGLFGELTAVSRHDR
ncbi:MAG TPA: TIGR03118 family protein [Solirubrobacteraceae bacterium]|nr:TIGR03118 family protein [Solirubrobacteraceae bacterium]